MPRGDKSKYSNKQKRQAEKIEGGYESKGISEKESKRRAWATVNKMWGGGKRGSKQASPLNPEPAKKGGRLGGKAAAKRPSNARSASAKKAAATRERNKMSNSEKR